MLFRSFRGRANHQPQINTVDPGLTIVVTVALALFVALTLIRLNGPITDAHGFRQTQTAISIREMTRGGPLLRYETPVLGPPWSIPFELPVYQWVVAGLAVLFGTRIPATGRIVSAAMFLLAVAFIDRIARRIGFSRAGRAVFTASMLLSPIYVFWSRTVMIESTALMLCAAFVAVALRAQEGRDDRSRPSRYSGDVSAFILGCSAAAVKPTTFVGAALFLSLVSMRLDRFRSWGTRLRVYLYLGASLVALVAWTAYADHQKRLSPLAHGLVSRAMMSWNFGTTSQKVDAGRWTRYLVRTLNDGLGYWVLVPVTLAVAVLSNRPNRAPLPYSRIGSSLVLFAAVPAVFTNLHFAHSYYPYANTLFVLAALALALSPDDAARWTKGAVIAVVVMFSCQATASLVLVGSVAGIDHGPNPELARVVRSATDSNDVVLAHGLDWSSELAYESDRRAIMDVRNRPLQSPAMAGVLEGLRREHRRIGAFIQCSSSGVELARAAADASRLGLRSMTESIGSCRVFVRQPH